MGIKIGNTNADTSLKIGNTNLQNVYIGTNLIFGNQIIKLLDNYPNAHHAYSLRKLRSAYVGACLRVRRTTASPVTSTQVDVGFDTNGVVSFSSPISNQTGTVTNATTLGQFAQGTVDGLTASVINVVTWYDQSGNNKNPTNATASQQPRLVNVVAGIATLETSGGKVAVRFIKSSSNNLNIADTSAFINNMSSYWVGAFVTTVINQIGYSLAIGNRYYFPYIPGANTFAGYDTSATAMQIEVGVTTSRRLYEILAPSPLNILAVQSWNNGVLYTQDLLAPAFAIQNITLGTGGTLYYNGYIQEVIGYQLNTNREGIENNINTYWQIYP